MNVSNGSILPLSKIPENGIIKYKNMRGIVIYTTLGFTCVQWEDNSRELFYWHHFNPDVQYEGQGRYTITIERQAT